MICESLGYFSVNVAAAALEGYINDEPFACEWYSHMSMCRGKDMFDMEEIKKIGRDVVESSFRCRKRHKGYMADFNSAIDQVKWELKDQGCTNGMLAAWF